MPFRWWAGASQAETDGGRLARAIQAEEAEDLALDYVQIEIVQRGERSISFREATNRNGGLRIGRAHTLVSEGGCEVHVAKRFNSEEICFVTMAFGQGPLMLSTSVHDLLTCGLPELRILRPHSTGRAR